MTRGEEIKSNNQITFGTEGNYFVLSSLHVDSKSRPILQLVAKMQKWIQLVFRRDAALKNQVGPHDETGIQTSVFHEASLNNTGMLPSLHS